MLHGGNDEQDVTLEDMFILDTNKLSWTRIIIKFSDQIERPIIGRYHHTMEVCDSYIYIIGGKNSNGSPELTFALNRLSLE